MSNNIRIKRSQLTATPATLQEGELAYSELSKSLFIGLSGGNIGVVGGVVFIDKLNGIEANANNYVHPTTTGNKHIPNGGSSGQILKWSADGTAIWGAETGAVSSVAGRTGIVTLTKSDVGLGNVDNTADNLKDVLTALTLKTARTIAGVSFNGSANIAIPLANLTTDTTHRVVTDTQLTQLSTLFNWYTNMTASDADGLLNTINEVLTAFSGASESLNIVNELASPTSMTLDGGTF